LFAAPQGRCIDAPTKEGGTTRATWRSSSFAHSSEDEGRFLLKVTQEKEKTTMMAQCPECEAPVNVLGLLIGEILYCPDCSAELEVLNVKQPQVALAPRVEEDWGE
jgi:alpha-aminoadipate/glutamate carrier protein LysW